MQRYSIQFNVHIHVYLKITCCFWATAASLIVLVPKTASKGLKCWPVWSKTGSGNQYHSRVRLMSTEKCFAMNLTRVSINQKRPMLYMYNIQRQKAAWRNRWKWRSVWMSSKKQTTFQRWKEQRQGASKNWQIFCCCNLWLRSCLANYMLHGGWYIL